MGPVPEGPDTLFYNAYEKARNGRSTGKFREMHRLLGKWFDVYLYPVPGGMTVLFNDITVSRQMEELPRLALKLLHNLKDNVFLLRADGRMFHVNNETKDSLGYSSDELHKMRIFDVVPQASQREWQDILDRIRQHCSMTFESRLRARDGREFPVEVYASYIEFYGSHYYTISARDITERKRAEVALRESEANLSRAQRIAHIGNWTWDTKKDLVYCSDEFYRIFGMPRQDYITYGQFINTLNPEDRDPVNGAVDAALNRGELYNIDYRVVWPDGNERIVHADGEVLIDQAGKPATMFGTVQDVTERKKVEETLEKYRLFSENAHDIVLFIRRDGRIFEANAAAVKAYGYTYEELLSLSIYDLRASEIGYHVDNQMDMAYDNGILFEAEHRRKDGSDFPVEVSSQGRIINGQKVLLSVVRDISERKRAEEALRETRDYLESLIDYANAPIIVWDPGFTITRFNHAFERLSGYSVSEVVGKDLSVLFPAASRDESLDNIRRTLAGEYWESVEIPILHKDGSIRIALWNSANIYSEDKSRLLATIAQGQDITGRKQAEDALQVAKAQAELYVDLMGHDINNMNQIAMGSLEVALMDLEQAGKLDASGKPLLEKSIESLTSSSQLIRNVQKLQRASMEGISLKAMNATAMLESVIREFQQSPGKDLMIDFSRTGDCMVSADELLKDVFVNLIGNAIKHSRADRPLTVGISADIVMEHGKKYCRFVIEDNGPGIPDEVKDRLFRRFSRGETKARGSGLGLYLVRTLVEHYGGNILVEDRVQGDYTKGARFVVTIPSVK